MTGAADLLACREAMRAGSRSFAAAGRLLPRAMRDPATALYAFCRAADDAVDEGEGGIAALAALRLRLDAVYRGAPDGPADRAFAVIVAAHRLPRALPDALMEGFAWDIAGRRYDDLPALTDYAMRVAGSVGVMMALLMGARTPAVLAAAADLGCAMQLTNIARDVGADARAGRVYLPLAWLREAGIDPDAWLESPTHSPALAWVVGRVLAEADRLYARALPGVTRLPARCRPAIRAAAALYRGIGGSVARNANDAVSQRATVPGHRKALLVARGLFHYGDTALAEPSPAMRCLLAGIAPAARSVPLWKRADDRIGSVVELFIRLNEASVARQRGARGIRNGSMS